MGFDGFDAEAEDFGDVAGAVFFSDEFEDFHFAVG